MTRELKDCPFCGCKATFVKHSAGMPGTMGYDRWDAVACKHCRATVGACDRRFREKDDAAAAWNRRAPDARDARIAELEAELATLKTPNSGSLPEMKQINDLPATPWYPDDSGEWVEVPEDLAEMPAALSSETLIEGLTRYERDEQVYSKSQAKARKWAWTAFPHFDNRIVAYKVVK